MTTITIDRATVEQALERLRKYHHGNGFAEDAECIADLEAALAQQAEPVESNRWEGDDNITSPWNACMHKNYCVALKEERERRLAQQAEPAQDQRCRAEPRSDGDFVCDCKIGECPSRSAALAQQAEPTPPDATAGLVDDLCLLHMGWVSDAEGVLHRAAMGRVIARATEVRRLRKIEQLKAQLAQMEGNT